MLVATLRVVFVIAHLTSFMMAVFLYEIQIRLFYLTDRLDSYAIALRLSCEVGWWGRRSFLELSFGRGSCSGLCASRV